MKYKLILDISKSLMFARFRQTSVAAIGVTFSITMFITLLSFMSGLNDLLDGLVINRTPHVRLYNEIKPSENQPINREYTKGYNFINSVKPKNQKLELHNLGSIIQTIKSDSRVLGFAPKISTPIFYNVGASDITGVVNGIDVDAENKLFFFSDYVTS